MKTCLSWIVLSVLVSSVGWTLPQNPIALQKYQALKDMIDQVDGQPGNEENPDEDTDYQDMFNFGEKQALMEAFTSSDRDIACQYRPEDVEAIDFMVRTIRSDLPTKEVIRILKEKVFQNEKMDERLILGIRLARKTTADRIEAKKCIFILQLHYANGLTKQILRDVLEEAFSGL